jgi:hypothetical protein
MQKGMAQKQQKGARKTEGMMRRKKEVIPPLCIPLKLPFSWRQIW